MRKILSLVFIILITFSCKNSNNKKGLPNNNSKLKINETNLDSTSKEFSVKQVEHKIEVKENILHCHNDKFIVKIDKLKNGEIRYNSWNKPKRIADEPNLTINNGKIEAQGTSGGFYYIFKNGKWKYVVENNLMAESEYKTGIFLKVLENGKEKLYQKMVDLTVEKNYDLESYSKNILIGKWWTPHYAIRKIFFYEDDSFILKNGEQEEDRGIFNLSEHKVELIYNNGKKSILTIGGGKENTSYTLVGDGENFVKEWEER